MNQKPGDTVIISVKNNVYKGQIIKRPDILEKGIIVLKLENGYNIGIDEKTITKIEIVKKYSLPKKDVILSKDNKSLPTIALLSTGGTISSRIDYRTGGVIADYTAEDFKNLCPEMKDVANIRTVKVFDEMSENFTFDHWMKIAKSVVKELNDKDVSGVVITQGTDTLHYTAAALSFIIENLNKPVIITGSQRSIDRPSSDAYMNLVCSVVAATKFDGAIVGTCLHGTQNDDYCNIVRGTRVRKNHTSRRAAFESIGEVPIAKVFTNGELEITNTNYKKRNTEKSKIKGSFNDKLAMIQVYPNMDPEIISYYMKKGCKALILNATAMGHVPVSGNYSLIPELEKAKSKKIPVIIATQTIHGRVHPHVYSNLRKLSIELGCLFVEDMLCEVAYAKLSWVLSQTEDYDKVKELMKQNIAEETTTRSNPRTF